MLGRLGSLPNGRFPPGLPPLPLCGRLRRALILASLSDIEFADSEQLSERTMEFRDIIALTPVTDGDRETPWYRLLSRLPIESTEWESRDDYVSRAYLGRIGPKLMFLAINSGKIKVYGAYPGKETLRMVPRVHFGINRWWENSVESGRYSPMNTAQDPVDGAEREARSNYILYIRNSDWPEAIQVLLQQREQFTGSVLDAQWRDLALDRAIAAMKNEPKFVGEVSSVYLPSPDRVRSMEAPASEMWNEGKMADAIRAWVKEASKHDRDVAWKEHFKSLQHEHGWKNASFRDHWSIALGSQGRRGPKPKSAR